MNYKFINKFYKKHNKLIIGFISLFVLLFNINLGYGAEKNIYYSAILKLESSSFRIVSDRISSNLVNLPIDDSDSGYYFSLVDKNNNTINKENLPPLKESPISSGNDNQFLINFQYKKNAEKIIITDISDNVKLTIDLTQYATCGNNECDKEENYKSCPVDCPPGSKDGYCDRIRDGICDTDCFDSPEARDNDCDYTKESISQNEKKSPDNKTDVKQPDKNISDYFKIIIFLIFVLLGLGLIIFGIIKFRKKDN